MIRAAAICIACCLSCLTGCGGSQTPARTPAQACASEGPTIGAGLRTVDPPGIHLLTADTPSKLRAAASASERLSRELRRLLPTRDASLPTALDGIAASLDRFAQSLPTLRPREAPRQLGAFSQQLTTAYEDLLVALTRNLATVRHAATELALPSCLVGGY